MASADDFEIPKLDEIRQRARDAVQSLVKEASLSTGADYDIFTRVLSVLMLPMFGLIRLAVQQIFPDTAIEKYVRRHGRLRGIDQKQASKSSGLALMRGLSGSTQPANATITAPSGVEVITTAARTLAIAGWSAQSVLLFDDLRPDTIVVSSTTGMSIGDIFGINGNFYGIKDLPGGGAIIIYGRFKVPPKTTPPADVVFPESGALLPIQSKLDGAGTNLEYGVILTFATPVVEPECEVVEMGGGADLEALKDWARRMQEHDAENPAANNRSQALLLLLAQPGVGEGYVWDVFRGLGTADLTPQGVKGARHLGAARIAELQDRIAPIPPTDANPGFVAIGGHDWKITDFADLFVPMDLILTGGPGFGPDWLGSLITAGGSTTSRVNTTTDPRVLLTIGARVVIPTGPPLFIEMSKINSIDAAGFGLETSLTVAPIAGKTILPGSNLIEPVRDNILDMFDNLGPGDTNPPTRYPAPTTRGPDQLSLNLIHATVRAVRGVKNLLIVTPAADITPLPKAQCVLLDLVLRYA
jgi:uncharacterized phage protein gp47/JayE